jgi:hypothetical protein
MPPRALGVNAVNRKETGRRNSAPSVWLGRHYPFNLIHQFA